MPILTSSGRVSITEVGIWLSVSFRPPAWVSTASMFFFNS